MVPTVQPRRLPEFYSEPGTTADNAIGVKATEIAAGNFNGAYPPLTRRCSNFKIEPFRPVGGTRLPYYKLSTLITAPRQWRRHCRAGRWREAPMTVLGLPITPIFQKVAPCPSTFPFCRLNLREVHLRVRQVRKKDEARQVPARTLGYRKGVQSVPCKSNIKNPPPCRTGVNHVNLANPVPGCTFLRAYTAAPR